MKLNQNILLKKIHKFTNDDFRATIGGKLEISHLYFL